MKIEIFNNVFNSDLTKEIWSSLMRPKWSLTGGDSRISGRFWHMDNLEKESFYHTTLFQIFCDEILKEKISSYKINRCYANGQTANQSGSAHIDDEHPNTFTLLYYPNLEWHWSWNGALFFLDHIGLDQPLETEIFKTISYKPNRAIYFPSNICHYAEAPSSRYDGLRVSLAWKLTKL
tara:strand:+ start:76 stop:609 length:534 start_codon:yes stop_codon:yes gene_type:complete